MNFQERARYVIEQEAEAIRSIPLELVDTLSILAEWILDCQGKVITTGMGKNGLIARRVAATLSCTGTSSFYVHSSEVGHGDKGMISDGDILLAFSNSGKTQEIIETVEKTKEVHGDKVKIGVITGYRDSHLSKLADISIVYGEIIEPCPLGLTPSSSLAIMSALADALALGIMELRGFTLKDYSHNHKNGYISKKIAEQGKLNYNLKNE